MTSLNCHLEDFFGYERGIAGREKLPVVVFLRANHPFRDRNERRPVLNHRHHSRRYRSFIAMFPRLDRYDSPQISMGLVPDRIRVPSEILDWGIGTQTRLRNSIDPDARRLVHRDMRPLFLYVATTAGSLLVGTAILTGSTALTITTVRSAVILKKVRREGMTDEREGNGDGRLTHEHRSKWCRESRNRRAKTVAEEK